MGRMGQYRALQERTENESIFKTVSLLCSDFLFQLLHRTEQNRTEEKSLHLVFVRRIFIGGRSALLMFSNLASPLRNRTAPP
jgi:hypothetical protein